MHTVTHSKLAAVLVSVSLIGGSFPGSIQAALIGTEQVINSVPQADAAARVAAFLAREDVARELTRHGVDPQDAQARVAAMSEQELSQLAGKIDSLPAGAGLLEVVGIVFVILLILELVGVTNIFHSP
jgi:hypothetical protein